MITIFLDLKSEAKKSYWVNLPLNCCSDMNKYLVAYLKVPQCCTQVQYLSKFNLVRSIPVEDKEKSN